MNDYRGETEPTIGLGLAPNDPEPLIRFRKALGNAVTGPELGLDENVPHLPLFQGRFDPDDVDILEFAPEGQVLGVLSGYRVSEPDELLVDFVIQPEVYDLARRVTDEMRHRLVRVPSDWDVDRSAWPDDQLDAFNETGYRYSYEAWCPHIFLGSVPHGLLPAPGAFRSGLMSLPIYFDRFVVYRTEGPGSCEILESVSLSAG